MYHIIVPTLYVYNRVLIKSATFEFSAKKIFTSGKYHKKQFTIISNPISKNLFISV